jgi:hypothetical protein
VKTLSIILILLATLIFHQPLLAQDQLNNYCNDGESWREWDDLAMRYPDDLDVQALHALRVGLCIKVKNGTIPFAMATDIFNRMHEMVVAKKSLSRGINKVKVKYSIIQKIISGGQTGADRGALDAAIKLDVSHGGWIPKGRLTEDGPLPGKYNLEKMPTASYPKRIEKNILDSDGTVIITHGILTGESALTGKLAQKHNP